MQPTSLLTPGSVGTAVPLDRPDGAGAAPAADQSRRSTGRDDRRAHLVALLAFAACAVFLFRATLFDGWTFIGDSDRLNTVLNMRLFEVTSIHARGAVPTWSEQQFMGYGIVGLHWMLPALTPFPYLLARVPVPELFRAIDVVAAGLLAMAMMAAYWCLGAYSSGPLPRAGGALAYGLSAYAIQRIAQLDLPFGALILLPLLVMLVRGVRRDTAARSFLGIAVCWAALTLLTFFQEVAYIAMLFGAYALYRSVRLRDPWPALVAASAAGCGILVGLPRVITVGAELPRLARTTQNLQTYPIEALRFFGDGLLGRYMGEGRNVLRGMLNMHEGVQLLASPLAALVAVAGGLSSRSGVLRTWGVLLVVVLSVALAAYFPSVYSLGYGSAAFPSREVRALLANALVIGLPLWLTGAWLARRAGPGGDERRVVVAPNLAPQAAPDEPFFLAAVVLVLGVILIPELRAVLYYGFFRVDFMHSRVSIAAILPLAALTTIFLSRYRPARPAPGALRWSVAGVAVGLLIWLGRELAAEAVVARIGPIVDVRPRLLTLEVVRVVTSLLVLLIAMIPLARRGPSPSPALAGGVLACWIGLEAIAAADFRLGGPHTREQAAPFVSNNFMHAPPGAIRPPTASERAAVRERLDVDRYRSVVLQDRDDFPALVEPHLAAFWGLRLVEGYSTGLPSRLAALPWAESMGERHHLDIQTFHDPLPWRLLAALNVKYAVVVDRSLWFNPAPGGADPPLDPARLRLLENPYPVAPRAFFAARVTPAGSDPMFPGDTGVRPPPADPFVEDPAAHSVAEGIADERTSSTAGTLAATFDGDRVLVRVDPAPEPRFLVLNEMYHPAWRATVDGQPAEIYPTNLVMRGVVVPPGATAVELRFVPFMVSWLGISILAAGLVVTGFGWWALRRFAAR